MIPLADLLPQKDPMILLSGYAEGATSDEVTSFVEISPKSPFYEPARKGVPSCVALEYMAQTMALLVGIMRRAKGLPPQVGFVLGTRKLELLLPVFENGKRYSVKVKSLLDDDEFGSFDCVIETADGSLAARGTLTAYQAPEGLDERKLENYA